MSFWDEPTNLPPNSNILEGQAVEGTIRMRVVPGAYGQRLKYTIDGGIERWASMSLWRILAALRIEQGDPVRIQRGDDTPNGGQTWTVERLTRTTQAQVMQHTAAVPVSGPSW